MPFKIECSQCGVLAVTSTDSPALKIIRAHHDSSLDDSNPSRGHRCTEFEIQRVDDKGNILFKPFSDDPIRRITVNTNRYWVDMERDISIHPGHKFPEVED